MNEKEKYRAKVEAKITSFNQSIEELTTKAKLQKVSQPDIKIENLLKKQESAQAKLEELEKSDENSWQKIKTELDSVVQGVDEELRQAMAYFG